MHLHFVPVDQPKSRNHSGEKPESQRYLTAARQHVMRDIGLSRRKKRKRLSKNQHFELAIRPSEVDAVRYGAEDRAGDEWHAEGLLGGFAPANSDSIVQTGCKPTSPSCDPVTSVLAIRRDKASQLHYQTIGGIRIDPFARWPIDTTPRVSYLVDYLLTTDCETVRPLRSISWPLLSLDPGIFYHALAIAAFCLSARALPGEVNVLASEALYYYNKGVNDGIIVSILGMALHDLTNSSSSGWCWEMAPSSPRWTAPHADEWSLHMRAVRTILRSRGGSQSIDSNRLLRLWLFALDIEGATTRDVQPFFPLPLRLLPNPRTLHLPNSALLWQSVSIWKRDLEEHVDIIEVFVDLASVVGWLSQESGPENISMWMSHDWALLWLVPLLHRCLQLSSQTGPWRMIEGKTPVSTPANAFQEALRHSMILFLAPIRMRLGIPAGGTESRLAMLVSALDSCLVHPAASQLQRLIFWMLVAGSLEACRLGVRTRWFCLRLAPYCAKAGVMQADQIERMINRNMSEMVWIKEIMGPGLRLMSLNVERFLQGDRLEPNGAS